MIDRPEVLEVHEGTGTTPEEMRGLCPEEAPAPALAVDIDTDKAEQPDDLPAHIVEMRDEKVTAKTDRSKCSYALLAECVEAGLSNEAALAVARAHAPSVDKYGNGARLTREVARSLGKLREDAEGFANLNGKTAAKVGTSKAAPATALEECRRAFDRWLHTRDHRVLHAVLGAYVANHLEGDPVWLLVVGPPSSSKTEHLNPLAGRPDVHPAATLTEAALLSGTPKREAKGARGGLLRVIGDYGILLLKDFTSVLAQNKDTRAQVLGALREIYDGAWTRHVGTDGGRTLDWTGKVGLIGGCTPAIDQHHAVLSALGDRFILLRLPEVDPDELTRTALRHLGKEATMRAELAKAAAAVIEAADLDRATRTLAAEEEDTLRDRAIFAVRARSAVTRDGYSQEVLSIPEPEGPPRFLLGLRRLLGGLEAIGCTSAEAWEVIDAVTLDSMPATRRRLLEALMATTEPTKTAPLATSTELPTRTASRHLEDLALLRLAVRTKTSDASNAPDLWQPSDLARRYWPASTPENREPADTDDRSTPESPGAECSDQSPLTTPYPQEEESLAHSDNDLCVECKAEPARPTSSRCLNCSEVAA